MRKLREGMADDLSFRNVYSSSNGSAIIEVIHESSKNVEDRVHPVSYMAFINMPNSGQDLYRSTRSLTSLWKGDGDITGLEDYAPLTGFWHDTLWSAKAAVEMDEDPARILDTFEKVAREERNWKGRGNAERNYARRFDNFLDAIATSREAGKLPANLVADWTHMGGGSLGVSITFEGYENPSEFWMVFTDCFYGVALCQYWMDNGEEAKETMTGDNCIDISPNVEDEPSDDEWDLTNPKCIAEAVRTLENMQRYAGFYTEMLPTL